MTATITPRRANRRGSAEPPRTYRYADIAAMYNLSLSQVSELSCGGVLPGRIEIGRAVLHDRVLVDRWYAELVGGNDNRAA